MIDKSPYIVGAWTYLLRTSSAEIAKLPLLEPGDDVQNLTICQEAKWLIGFWIMLAQSIERGDHHGFVGRVESMTCLGASLADIPRIAAEQRDKEGWELTGTRRMDSQEGDSEYRWLLDFERVVAEC